MSSVWFQACAAGDVAPGGVKYVRSGEQEIAVCNVDGRFYAVGRRCGHMNAPLEQGPLDGPYLTCPLHDGQFDIRTGKNLAWPIDHDLGPEDQIPEPVKRYFALEHRLQWKTRVHDLHTYPARVTDGAIEVDVPE